MVMVEGSQVKHLLVVSTGVAIILVAAASSFLLMPSILGGGQDKAPTISWQRTGGIMGLREEFVVAPDGRTNYTSNYFGSAQLVLNGSMVKELQKMMESITTSKTYTAMGGAADFFFYTLTLNYSGSPAKVVRWVDAWASTETLPSQFSDIQSLMTSLVQEARAQGEQSDGEQAKAVAVDFLTHAPTFSFDGMAGTMNVTDVVALESYPVQYVVHISFVSAHPGYGDRTGQMLLQVLAHHEAVVRVVSGQVVSAVIDQLWDELGQHSVSS
jgi:hypothetical protein